MQRSNRSSVARRRFTPPTRALGAFIAFVGMFLSFGGCGFDLAGQGESQLDPSGVPRGGPRAELFKVDKASVTVVEKGGGDPATFSVALAQTPTAAVTIPIAQIVTPINPGGRIVAQPTSLTFSVDAWDKPQTVTLSASENSQIDPVDWVMGLGPATSSDPLFNGADPSDVKVQLTDTNEAITVSPRVDSQGKPYTVTERSGAQPRPYYVSLAAKPTDRVSVTLTVEPTTKNGTQDVTPHDELEIADGEGSAGAEAGDAGGGGGFGNSITLIFPAGTEAGQLHQIYVRGKDDSYADGDVTARVLFAPAGSNDPRFTNKVAAPLEVVNIDDDSPNVVVDPPSAISTTEGGGTVSFLVTLGSAPQSPLTIPLSISNPGEAKWSVDGVNGANIEFKGVDGDWKKGRTVVVTGKDDQVVDGNVSYDVILGNCQTDDPAYKDKFGRTVTLSNIDDDDPAIIVAPSVTVAEKGSSSTVGVTLLNAPNGDVFINVSNSAPGQASIDTSQLHFTPQNWNVQQSVTVSAVDDPYVDNDQSFQLTFSVDAASEPAYLIAAPKVTNGTALDDDTGSITILGSNPLGVVEGGGGAFNVQLGAPPGGTVVVSVTSFGVGLSPGLLTFNAGNYNVPQQVNVTMPGDCVDTANQDILVNLNAGSDYSNASNSIHVTRIDNDTAAYSLSTSSITTTNGGTASFTVNFATRPQNDLIVPVVISPTSKAMLKSGTTEYSSLNYSISSSGSCTQGFTVVVVGKASSGSYTVTVGPPSGSPEYNGLSAKTVSGTDN